KGWVTTRNSGGHVFCIIRSTALGVKVLLIYNEKLRHVAHLNQNREGNHSVAKVGYNATLYIVGLLVHFRQWSVISKLSLLGGVLTHVALHVLQETRNWFGIGEFFITGHLGAKRGNQGRGWRRRSRKRDSRNHQCHGFARRIHGWRVADMA